MDTNPLSRITHTTQGADPARRDPVVRAIGIVLLIGVAIIGVTCLIVQFLRTDLDWTDVSLSLYVRGPYGPFVQASFFAPAPGIAALGFAWRRALERRARSTIALVMFAIAGTALCVMAANVAKAGSQPATVHGQIHLWAAFAAFVFVSTAMLVQSVKLRLDAHWHVRFPVLVTIASVAVVFFWTFALVKPIPRGLGEKVEIGVILLWLWLAAWWLVRDAQSR